MTTWMTLAEAAGYARMKNSRRITQAIKDGELPSVNPFKGNMIQNVRLKQSDVDAWMEAQPWSPEPSSSGSGFGRR